MRWDIVSGREKGEFLKFKILTIPALIQDLKRQIKFIKGIDIHTYYTPTDLTKEKEPLLNINLQRKWLWR